MFPLVLYIKIMKSKTVHFPTLADALADLGWEYDRLTKSGKESYDKVMTLLGILNEGETWE